MTRKCIMCKGKNYKNACSFFSAPKDPETRLLWQQVINIKDYIVNDDTYVCSKHFNKDDIITHWVSGVPPQVITIKYKKCRLRRGAVPIPVGIKNNVHSKDPLNFENDIILDDEKYILESSQKKIDSNNKSINSNEVTIDNLNCNLEDEIYEYIPEDSQEPEEIESNSVSSKNSKRSKMSNKNELDKHEAIYSTNHKEEIVYIQCSDIINDTALQKSNSNIDSPQNVVKYLPKKTYGKAADKDSNKSLQSKVIQKTDQIVNQSINWNIEPINENLDVSEIIEIDELGKESKKDNVVYKSKSLKKDITDSNNLMLFEDFLEIFNETSLPSSWFASMVSKENITTIVYSCMNISNAGMPYVEKKVFLNNEMIIRCAVLNKEIDITDNLNNKKNLHVYTLSDVEEFIEEFDQTPICSGLNNDCVYSKNSTKVLFDGVCWRHNECYMILSKGQSICLKCSTLMISKRL